LEEAADKLETHRQKHQNIFNDNGGTVNLAKVELAEIVATELRALSTMPPDHAKAMQAAYDAIKSSQKVK
jgi:hypothetical protein